MHKKIFLFFLILSLSFIEAYSSPINSNVIVVLSNNKATLYTASKISELTRNAMMIIGYDFYTRFTLLRIRGQVILVSHGDPNGIEIGSKIVTWERFARELKTTAKSIFIASCYSYRAVKLIKHFYPEKFIFGFKGLVDVDEAAYIIAGMIKYRSGNIYGAENIMKSLVRIMIGKIIEPWKYYLWLLAWDPGDPGSGHAYYVRGIWWVYWAEWQTYDLSVAYTHPNTYKMVDPYHYYEIGVDEKAVIRGDDFAVEHFSRDETNYMIAALSISASALTILAVIVSPIHSSLVAGFLASALGMLLSIYTGSMIKDEKGASWLCIKDWEGDGEFYLKIDLKLGRMQWYRGEWFGYDNGAYLYPLYYGGRELGIGGI